jgi:hypothetical protein
MKTDTLEKLEPLLRELRSLDGLIETKAAEFSLKSSPRDPFLHFHEQETGLIADLRIGPDNRGFGRGKSRGRVRLPVNDGGEQAELLELVLECFRSK